MATCLVLLFSGIWGPILSDATEDWDPCKTLTEHWKVTMVVYCHCQDLEAALANDHRALQLPPEGHPEILRSLGISYIYRYEIFKDRKDLEEALHSNEAAVQPRADLLEKLRNLGELFMHNPPSKDWNAQSSPLNAEAGQTDLISRLQNLAVALTEQYESEGDQRALDTALFAYHTSFQGAIPDPAHAWSAAQRWASLTKLHKPDSDCLRAYLCGFKLLPEIFWVGQPLSGRQQTLMEIDIATATSNAINAEKLQSLSSELYSGTSENAREIGKEWSGLLKVIEERATHQYRLGPKPFVGPKRFAELTEAAREGPVIILNSHEDHCDAIVVQHAAYSFNLLHVPLPDVSVKTLKHQRLILHELLGECNVRSRVPDFTRLFGFQERFTSKPVQECFEDLLSWLWTNIVSPIYNALDSDGNRGDRLWWCPTGAFTGFPLHAAAKSDRYIQSYTSSLSALIEAKGRIRSNSPRRVTVPTIGLVGVTHSGPGQYQSLPGVEKEIETIKSLLAEKYQVQSLTGEEATVEAVKLQLENCSWLHLACHGTQDLCNPPKSHLVLYEGILKLETILRMPLSTAEFVFLAACETAKGSVDLVNESFHLCGGFIAAGFDGAIGTLWAMRDSDGPVVAEAVYSYLFKDNQDRRVTEAAKALHLAVRKMRDTGVPLLTEIWDTGQIVAPGKLNCLILKTVIGLCPTQNCRTSASDLPYGILLSFSTHEPPMEWNLSAGTFLPMRAKRILWDVASSAPVVAVSTKRDDERIGAMASSLRAGRKAGGKRGRSPQGQGKEGTTAQAVYTIAPGCMRIDAKSQTPMNAPFLLSDAVRPEPD
ncbi:CHAT domain-containing protein [Mycena rebaudengoi]|nr:CHAT domain-containing protein [Mycena rebaudengoi]